MIIFIKRNVQIINKKLLNKIENWNGKHLIFTLKGICNSFWNTTGTSAYLSLGERSTTVINITVELQAQVVLWSVKNT